MGSTTSRNQRRFWVVINCTSLIVLLFFFYYVQHTAMDPQWLIIEVLPVAGLIYSHVKAYGKTQLWKLSHVPTTQLDEREIQAVYRAVSISYAVFVVVVLIIVYGFAIIDKGPIDVLLAGVLLYLAHILPSSILAWNEKRI